MELLKGLLANRQFDLIGAPIIILVFGSWLTYDFIRTRRAVKAGEPLRVWYLRYPIYPDDLAYSYFAFQREYPAIMFFAFIALILLVTAGVVIWAFFWAPH